jgi:GMP synthase (glutamine-hydrolysing)
LLRCFNGAALRWPIAMRRSTISPPPISSTAISSSSSAAPSALTRRSLTPSSKLRVIEKRLRVGKPVLGICLGGQLLAGALGARVYRGNGKEIGWSPLTLTAAGRRSCLAPLGDGTPVLHWHGDTFDLPKGATHLASTERYRHQAFAWEHHGLALQFHLEVAAAGLERWYIGHACEIAGIPGLCVPMPRAEAEQWAPALAPLAARCLEAWLDGLP